MLVHMLVLKWILPEEMGLWNKVTIYQPYIQALQLGIFVALNRELPYLLGQDNHEKAVDYVKTAGSWANIISLLILILVATTTILKYSHDITILQVCTLLSFGFYVALTMKQNYLVVTYRSKNDFKKLGKIYLLIIPLYIALIFLVYYFHYYGFLLLNIIAPLILVILLQFKRPYRVKYKFSWFDFKALLKIGIPLFVINYVFGIAATFKKILILKYFSTIILGLFSPALGILGIGRLLPSVLGQFIYPQMSFYYGKNNDLNELWRTTIRSSLYTTLMTIPVVLILYFILPYLFKYAFPAYLETYHETQIVLLSIIMVVPQMAYNALNTIKAFKTMIILASLKLLIYWFVILLSYKLIGKLSGIAWGIVFSDLLFSLVVILGCFYELKVKKP